jgi:hypothetical protein
MVGNEFGLKTRDSSDFMRMRRHALVACFRPEQSSVTTSLYDPQYTYFKSAIGAHLGLSEETQRAEEIVNFKTWLITVYRGEELRGGDPACARDYP